MATYARPESLVTTQWVADHLDDPHIRLIEVGLDTSEYDAGHIPGTVAGWGYFSDIHRPDSHDIPNKMQIETMLSQAGITNNDTVILYGGLSNLVAALAFWILRMYGHRDVRLLDGGRQKWITEGRPLTTERPMVTPTQYHAEEPNWNMRADKDYILNIIGRPNYMLVDARSVDMYSGGHIPTAINIPAQEVTDTEGNFQRWQTPTTRDDGTFKSVEELQALVSEQGVTPDKTIITYCVRGGLSSHMWFVLTYLLGYPNVRDYDRSWVEWGNTTDLPIET